MSPQSSSLRAEQQQQQLRQRQRAIYCCGESSRMSNSQIAQAASEAFHQRLDCDFNDDITSNALNYCPITTMSTNLNNNISTSNNRLQLKKRKKSREVVSNNNSNSTFSTFESDFVSGIFRDLSQVQPSDIDSSSDQPDQVLVTDDDGDLSSTSLTLSRPSKRFKSSCGKIPSLASSYKSFAFLNTLAGKDATNTSSDVVPPQSAHPFLRRVSLNSERSSSTATATTTVVSDETIDTDHINSLVDKVLIESLPFPSIPPTVSSSSCSSNNLTQTAVPAAQVLETPGSIGNTTAPSLEGGMHDSKDTYGWFVDMDLDLDDRNGDDVPNPYEKINEKDALSFKAVTALKKTTDLDEEVEWAKAADTVDDVLGDLF